MAVQPKKRIVSLQRKQQFLYLGLFTFVVIVVWVGTSIFRSQQQTGISSELQKMAVPLNPNIDTTVIDRLESKTSYSPEELQGFEVVRFSVEEQNRVRATQETIQPSLLEVAASPAPPQEVETELTQ